MGHLGFNSKKWPHWQPYDIFWEFAYFLTSPVFSFRDSVLTRK